ncbi:MAG: FimB/Mfa2 family fimbrial subunit [Tannerellaceae bacterium]|jgi:hypothetical protein|nr:FimB/Mfa2 family fimbrial subunit [Tannerellaceae bacterium]
MKILKAMFLMICPVWILSSCEGKEPGDSSYNLRIVYRYSPQDAGGGSGTDQSNVLGSYVKSLEEYVYDANGRLYGITRKINEGQLVSELKLPPGRYTVVAWGNNNNNSVGGSAALERAYIAPSNVHALDPFVINKGDLLFYGYKTCEVREGAPTHLYVNMEPAYCDLTVTLQFGNAARAAATSDYYFMLTGMPSHSIFLPGYAVNNGEVIPYGHKDPLYDDPNDNDRTGYLPLVNDYTSPISYRHDAVWSENTLSTQFLTHRLSSDTHPVLSLWNGTQRIMKDIDLYTFFQAMSIQLDAQREQKYSLGLEIVGNQVNVRNMSRRLDWDDAGGGW